MKKETVIAISFGVLFGILVALILLAKNKDFQLTKTKTIAPTEKENKVTKKEIMNIKSLEIIEPLDSSIFNTNSVKIKGKAEKDSLIIIQSPIKDEILKNEKEEFSVTFPLVLGENVIKVTAHPKSVNSRPQELELRVYYLEEGL